MIQQESCKQVKVKEKAEFDLYNFCYELIEKRQPLYLKAKVSGTEIAMIYKMGLDSKKTELEIKRMDLELKKVELEIEKMRYDNKLKAFGFDNNKDEVIHYNIPNLKNAG